MVSHSRKVNINPLTSQLLFWMTGWLVKISQSPHVHFFHSHLTTLAQFYPGCPPKSDLSGRIYRETLSLSGPEHPTIPQGRVSSFCFPALRAWEQRQEEVDGKEKYDPWRLFVWRFLPSLPLDWLSLDCFQHEYVCVCAVTWSSFRGTPQHLGPCWLSDALGLPCVRNMSKFKGIWIAAKRSRPRWSINTQVMDK